VTSELLEKIGLLKQKVISVKQAPMLQKASRAEAAIEDAVFIIEVLAIEQVRLEKLVDDLVTVGG
jgi:hypothetical protein